MTILELLEAETEHFAVLDLSRPASRPRGGQHPHLFTQRPEPPLLTDGTLTDGTFPIWPSGLEWIEVIHRALCASKQTAGSSGN
jgi:hypothetical protein